MRIQRVKIIDEKQRPFSIDPHITLQWIERHAKLLTAIRDGLLVFAGIVYLLGYMSWSYNALKHSFGYVPASQPQYMVAGFVPSIFIGLTLLVFIASVVIARNLSAWSEEKNEQAVVAYRRRVIFLPVFVLFLIVLIGTSIVYRTKSQHQHFSHSIIVIVCIFSTCLLVFLMSGILANICISNWISVGYSATISKIIHYFFFMILPIIISITVFFMLYVKYIYPIIPCEFGGTKTRFACLDITRAQIGKETREALLMPNMVTLPPATTTDLNAVVQTVELEVLYDGSDTMFVRQRHPNGPFRKNLFQIKKSIIQNVTWIP